MTTPAIRLLVVVATIAALAASAGAVAAANLAVAIAGLAFSPATTSVTAGDTVTWTNGDAVAHTVTGDGFDTGPIDGGASASLTFATVGTFAYHCQIHPSMEGTVVVHGQVHGDPVTTAPPTDSLGDTGVGPGVPSGIALTALVAAAVVGLTLGARRLAPARVRRRRR